MITVPEIVEELVKKSPLLEEGLASGIINLSSLARKFQPEIRQKLMKDIQLGAIVMALKRLESRVYRPSPKVQSVLENLGNITIRSNLVNFTFSNSPTMLQNQLKLFEEIKGLRNSFFTITEGLFETSITVSANMEEKIQKIFKEENLKLKLTNLSSLTIIIPEEGTYIPGIYYSILKTLAWEGISFVDVVSSLTELTIFIEDKNLEKAFSALKNLTTI